MSPKWSSITTKDLSNYTEHGKVDLFNYFVTNNEIVSWSRFSKDPEDVAHALHKKKGHMRRTGHFYRLNLDHGRIYKMRNNDRIYVCHPYLGDRVDQFRCNLNLWAQENGLVAEVYEPTYDWY